MDGIILKLMVTTKNKYLKRLKKSKRQKNLQSYRVKPQ